MSPGEYAYIDDAHNILCRLEVRQCERTKITLDTTDGFFIVQGNAQTEEVSLHETANELLALIKRFCDGQTRILSE